MGQDTGPWGPGPGGAGEQGLVSQCLAPSMGLGAPAGGRDGRSDGRDWAPGKPPGSGARLRAHPPWLGHHTSLTPRACRFPEGKGLTSWNELGPANSPYWLGACGAPSCTWPGTLSPVPRTPPQGLPQPPFRLQVWLELLPPPPLDPTLSSPPVCLYPNPPSYRTLP